PPQPVRAAIVLVNLGTPAAPTTPAVRKYLAEFLWDPRVIDTARWLWWLVLNLVVLRLRPPRSARAYQQVWSDGGSPLQVGTRALADKLHEQFTGEFGDQVIVRHAMRYGEPSVPTTMRELGALGVRRMLFIPLFPQFSATTTASVLDCVGAELRNWRYPPELRFVNDYHDQPAHIEALARSVEAHWIAKGRGQRLMLSFHGIPQRYVRDGDPYRDQCGVTAERVRERLGLSEEELILSFQSRVGREPWLQPYTDKTLEALPGQGVKRIDAMCPGFSIDCLETLEEIAIEGRDSFLEAGGERFEYIGSLNDSDDQVASIAALVRRHVQGWPEFERMVASGAGVGD
ncbi:MAG: ferrochelatase, partial [Dokdonella sp.]